METTKILPQNDQTKQKKLNIFQAILMNDEARLNELMDNRTNKFILRLKTTDSLSRTPLYFAAQLGNSKVVEKFLLTAAANIESQDVDGWTPLFIACYNGHRDVAELLLENHANIEAKEKTYGWTPLFASVTKNHKEIVKLLLDEGAKIEEKDNQGRTPLWIAVLFNNLDIIRELIDRGANVNAVDIYGRTPAYIAVQLEKSEALSILASSKADLDIADKDGRTPLTLAYKLGLTNLQSFLIDHGADKQQYTALIQEENEQSKSGGGGVSGMCILKYPLPNKIKIMHLVSDGSRIWGNANDGSLLVWDGSGNHELLVHAEGVHQTKRNVYSMVVVDDEVWCASGNKEISIWKWRTPSKKTSDVKVRPIELVRKISEQTEFYCLAKVKLKNQVEVFGGSVYNSVYIWPTQKPYQSKIINLQIPETIFTTEEEKVHQYLNFISKILYVPRGGSLSDDYLLIAVHRYVYILNKKLGFKGVLKGHTNKITDMIVVGGKLWTSSQDAAIRIWDLDEKRCVQIIKDAHQTSTNCLANVYDMQIISGGYDQILKTWTSKTYKSRSFEQIHSLDIQCLYWDSHSGKLWVSSLDKSISIWK
eukprot:TRINITY_DN7663_c0_g1_i1.p1 TRINITY_DN7663_c0_g1~~TRINITY_DN7663_c0_g1_i1.p1  ORF type:complete len:592 (-),score=123.25 TRINITY_DN7663_c0_g1_i1:21-1796(-)